MKERQQTKRESSGAVGCTRVGRGQGGRVEIVVEFGDFLRLETELGPLVPVSTVAKLLRIGRQRAYQWIARGCVPVVKVWGQSFLPMTTCHLFAEQHPGKVAPTA